MGCADADTLAGLVAGTLAEDERAAILVHAAACEACHALLAGLVETRDDEAPRGPPRLGPGARVGRYVLGERLGAGGMGVVYAADDPELGRRVAVKLLRPDSGDEPGAQARERLMREARVLASLSHPNVVTVFDVGPHESDLFIAMELVEGGSLAAWSRGGRRTLGEILDCVIDAGRGLAAAHAAGFIHRDVKPDNVLVGADGRARVTDFGLAGVGHAASRSASAAAPGTSELTRAGTQMGTPAYMAPEQAAAGETGPRADQWSYCAMIYELVAGVRPFRADHPAARAAAIAAGQLARPAPGRHVPRWLLRIVARGLRAAPAERWDSVDDLLAALVHGRRQRGRIVRAVAVAGVALALGGAVVARGGSAPPAEPIGALTLGGEALHLADSRPGCECPMSACTTTCTSVCRASRFALGEPIPGISVRGRQEVLLGATGDGDAILFLAGTRCSVDHLWLARRAGATYVPVDLTDQIDRRRAAIFEGCCTLAADGRSMLLARPDHLGFVRVGLTSAGAIAPGDYRDLGALIPNAPAAVTAAFPVLAPDERTLFYRVYDSSLGPTDQGPLDATYAATRAELGAGFAPGTRLPGRARYYDCVSGISSDQLSLFMTAEFRTHVLVRASTDEPFTDPAPGMLPAVLPGWRAVPLADCQRIATTWTPGGCESEDIVWLEAR